MINHIQDRVMLNNGIEMPGFGLGVYKVEDGETVINAVKLALEHGYRSIDTASFYNNEAGVGKGIKKSGVPRKDIFVTSKVWNDQQGYDSTLQACEETLKKLDMDYLDLYLIHWPVKGLYKETWRAMEKLYKNGRVRAIGVSNFHIHHLQNLLNDCEVTPVINQVEYHPHLTQVNLKTFCEEHKIVLEAWSPLKRGKLLSETTLKHIGGKYEKTVAQVILRWDIQNNVITIPKSVHEHRIKENADVFNFSLTEEEMQEINSLNRDERAGTNPDSFD
ncbi:aldo/keto reductase [Virgibacillus halodenitrificans]|uniref:aldo/keto reductase n=1 Tax=Virgibacillus halodenitrificans TaxID=1482 RepID=UPI00136A2714|nr:aldo/keto reductase [Virgibacillus halodenitrificans]MYL45895.1 aldo/keto reductase [Virgibacillus halodenitrificans]